MMPVVFAGHGSPMVAIDDSKWRDGMKAMGGRILEEFGKPEAILAVSAHWMTDGLRVRNAADNPQVNDMYGFPPELYQVHYEPIGCTPLANHVIDILNTRVNNEFASAQNTDLTTPSSSERSETENTTSTSAIPQAVEADNSWGIDHGVWTVLCNMFPECDIPVVMMSVPKSLTPEEFYEVGRTFAQIANDNVLILGSGNVVHNLRKIKWDVEGGFDWAVEFDERIKNAVLANELDPLINLQGYTDFKGPVPTYDHYYPLLACFGAAAELGLSAEVWNEGSEKGSLSMTSYFWH